MTLLQQTNQHVLAQLQDLLSVISDQAYAAPLALLHNSSVGQHVRHTLEFYQCLYEQVPLGCVNYDARRRDVRLETEVAFSANFADDIMRWLSQPIEDIPLTMTVCFDSQKQVIQTTLMRELIYMTEHAIHHFAIIRIALTEAFPDIQLPSHFGVAYSTIQYRESLGV